MVKIAEGLWVVFIFLLRFLLYFFLLNILKRKINCSTNVGYQKRLSSRCEESCSACVRTGGNKKFTEADRKLVGNVENWAEYGVGSNMEREFCANSIDLKWK